MTFILLDAANLYQRAKHGIRGDAFTKGGMIIHTILHSIKNVFMAQSGTHLVVCRDGKSWRNSIYQPYKAHRRAKQAALSPSEKEDEAYLLNLFNELMAFIVEHTAATVLYHDQVEADDFIARWIQVHPHADHVIISTDTDYYQLLADNVKLYDGIRDHLITSKGTFAADGSPVVKDGKKKLTINQTGNNWFSVKEDIATVPTKGRFTLRDNSYPYTIDDGAFIIKSTVANMVMVGLKIEVPTKTTQTIDPEWELFKKIIRGDSSDNIFSAYPKVRETAILEAFNDRHSRSYAWNNMMQQQWTDHLGETNKVIDRFRLNETLIDLTKQPSNILQMIDDAIVSAIKHERPPGLGMHFLRFCKKHQMVNIAKYPEQHLAALGALYPSTQGE